MFILNDLDGRTGLWRDVEDLLGRVRSGSGSFGTPGATEE